MIIIAQGPGLRSLQVSSGKIKSPRNRRFVAHMYSILLLGALLFVAPAQAIVSDRHLQGVSALECDLESSQSEFRMLVNARKHTLQLENDAHQITYEEVSEDIMRFPLALPKAPMRICELQFPAGALVCTRDDGQEDLGFCLTIQ